MKTISLRRLVLGDVQAARMVPPSGFTAHLTVFAAGAMAFLAVFALALSLASGRLADRWGEELAGAATLRISGPAEELGARVGTALAVLDQTPGVAEARALTAEEQAELLAPWFGEEVSLEMLPVPRLIEIIAADPPYDIEGLRLRLEAEVPGAVLDDHSRFRRPLVDAAQALRRLGWLSILLITGTTAAMITLAANAALAANAQLIAVLRLVGARDGYIAQAFVRRFTLRAAAGAAAGTVLGVLAILALPPASEEGGFLTGLGFRGAGWLLPLLIPLLAGAVAWAATRSAARRRLRELG
ncbi:cell division transport system permease protein [Pontibaca methylaminivorans]|uniref:Cell division transport system permease protein n=2 Tax=Pontibaca methylaminivorans TaxID=515897 RepID=A0A1R3WNP7_9RHOB|nr:cell division transport system permease protein [Pontibaca methylaminivorans]